MRNKKPGWGWQRVSTSKRRNRPIAPWNHQAVEAGCLLKYKRGGVAPCNPSRLHEGVAAFNWFCLSGQVIDDLGLFDVRGQADWLSASPIKGEKGKDSFLSLGSIGITAVRKKNPNSFGHDDDLLIFLLMPATAGSSRNSSYQFPC